MVTSPELELVLGDIGSVEKDRRGMRPCDGVKSSMGGLNNNGAIGAFLTAYSAYQKSTFRIRERQP